MYDQAAAARNRILTRTRGTGPVGEMYRQLANILMSNPDSALRTSAVKQLADSCDNAIALMEKTWQSQGKSRHGPRSPGQSNG